MKYLLAYLLMVVLKCGSPQPLDHSSDKKVESPATAVGQPAEKTDTATIEPEMPPLELDYDTAAWTEITRLDPSILLDLRYATANNFVKEKMYECPRCFLRPDVARAIAKAHKALQKKGYGLKMYDCYRPRPIQWKLWNKVPDTRYVADPRKGSMHNRGMAVDLTIVDKNGQELDMGTDFATPATPTRCRKTANCSWKQWKNTGSAPPPPSGGTTPTSPKLSRSTIGFGNATEGRMAA
jgi:D-alanyl-D-alanine dipeptidase